MSLNTLTSIVAAIIRPANINQLISALVGQFVGRNSSGAPASGQDLGTAVYPWGTFYGQSINLNGQNVNSDIFRSKANRIVSGRTRTTSGQPDFLRASGSGGSFTILGATTSLELVIDNESVTIDEDLVVTGLTLAPAANNTGNFTDTNLADQAVTKFLTEDTALELLSIGSSAGSEIKNRAGFFGAFKTVSNEYYFSLINMPSTSVYFTNSYRGYFFDTSGNPVQRQTIAFNDLVTLMSLGWVFVQSNGQTVDVSYVTPIISAVEPTLGLDGNALTDGQYWFDIPNDTWMRYSTAAADFQQLNRMLIGLVVCDSTNCVATRSFDFTKFYDVYNSLELKILTASAGTSVISSVSAQNNINVYGESLDLSNKIIRFELANDMETGVSLSSSTRYFLYLTDGGQSKISDIKYYRRKDLRGLYHPYNNWRAVGEFYYNASPEVEQVISYKDIQGVERQYEYVGTNFVGYITPIKTVKYKIPIGAWDMNATADLTVEFTTNGGVFILDNKIVNIFVVIHPDTNIATGASFAINHRATGAAAAAGGITAIKPSAITLTRVTGGYFDSTDFDDTSINRGYVYIELEV